MAGAPLLVLCFVGWLISRLVGWYEVWYMVRLECLLRNHEYYAPLTNERHQPQQVWHD